jgi:hypothetical protein
MKYALKPETSNTTQPILSDDLPDKFAAESWAVKWAKEHAKDDTYTLEGQDSPFRARLFRASGGQWYITAA